MKIYRHLINDNTDCCDELCVNEFVEGYFGYLIHINSTTWINQAYINCLQNNKFYGVVEIYTLRKLSSKELKKMKDYFLTNEKIRI